MGDAASINPFFLKDLVVVAVVLFGVAASVVSMLRMHKTQKREIVEQPISVEQVEKPLTNDHHKVVFSSLHRRVDVLEGDVKALRGKMEMDKVEIISAGETRANELHRRIDAIAPQVIALLKDTKGLL